MSRPRTDSASQPPSPVSWFALLYRARADRNRTLFAVAHRRLTLQGIHVSFVPDVDPTGVEGRAVDRRPARRQAADPGLVPDGLAVESDDPGDRRYVP